MNRTQIGAELQTTGPVTVLGKLGADCRRPQDSDTCPPGGRH